MTQTAHNLTAERVRELLSYDAETGAFTWREGRRNQAKQGQAAGSTGGNGYRLLSIDNRRYNAHRVAWLYVYGEWPQGQVDHIDGDKTNNRMGNLRVVSPSTNRENMRKSPKTAKVGALGVRTVTFSPSRPYQARITVKGKEKHIGLFESVEAAHAAYINEKRRLHAGCTI
jgi:DUF971 family protein